MLINEDLAAELSIDQSYIASETARQLEEIERRREIYFGNSPPAPLVDRTVIIVDDGIATGTARTTLFAPDFLTARSATPMVLPVAPHDTLQRLRPEADEIVCLDKPDPFIAVGAHYIEFSQLADADVIYLLEERHRAIESSPPESDRAGRRAPVDYSKDQ